MINCTFSGNYVAIETDGDSIATLTNCVLWGNEMLIFEHGYEIINYCCIQDLIGALGGTGNIDADPLFIDVSDGDLRLLPDSPCIDAGDNTAVPPDSADLDNDGNTVEPIPWDLDGNPRFVDQPEVPDTGNGTAPIVDMGAYEADYIKVPMKLTPRVLNPKSKGKWLKAHFVLPEGFSIEDVNTNTPAVIEPLGIESDHINVFINEDELVKIEAVFSRSDFCRSATSNDDTEVIVIGLLNSGQDFYGTDTIRIINRPFEQLAVFVSHWLQTGCGRPDWCSGTDLDRNSVVNFVDFAMLEGCCIEVTGQ